jgi:hypothetical protein
METKKFTQFGTFSVIVILPLLIFFMTLIFLSGFDDTFELIIFGFLVLTFLIFLLIFYKLTIYIDKSHVVFKLGNGLIQKKYPLSEIESCKPVKNPALYGIGIRLTPEGWLYNVSGLYAIELTFRNKKSKVRIGTNKPDEIARIINNLINKQETEFTFDRTGRSGFLMLWIILAVTLVLSVILIIYGNRETKIDFTDSGIIFKGMYGLTINYSDIKSVDTLNSLPRIKIRTNGYALGKTLKGNFKLYDQSKVKLYVKKGFPPYISIKTETTSIYLNYENPDLTVDTFEKIKSQQQM